MLLLIRLSLFGLLYLLLSLCVFFRIVIPKLPLTSPPASMKLGTFVTDVSKYTEKIGRKNLTLEKKVQAPAPPDKHSNHKFDETAVVCCFFNSIQFHI